MAKKRWRKKLLIGAISITSLLGGVSAYGLYELKKINTEEFANSSVSFFGKKIPLQEFYENVKYKNNQWLYTSPHNNKTYRLDVITDFVHRKNKEDGQTWRKLQGHRYTKIDTVYYVKVENDSMTPLDKPKYLYKRKDSDECIPMPTIGKNNPHGKVITQYEPLNGQKERAVDQYNDYINCTSDHEDQHEASKNPGSDLDNSLAIEQIGQSYELTFAETCWNEIISNISQFLSQRDNYIAADRDSDKFASRFQFYPQAVKEGKFNPQLNKKISPKELEFIADSIMSEWMGDKFPIYHNRNMNRTLSIHSTTCSNYNSVQENIPKHIAVLKDKMVIKGYDFFPYLYKREQEILDSLTAEDKALFAKKVAEKRKGQTHLGDLEWTRMSQGQEAYEARIHRNVRAAQANKVIRKIKKPWLFMQKKFSQSL